MPETFEICIKRRHRYRTYIYVDNFQQKLQIIEFKSTSDPLKNLNVGNAENNLKIVHIFYSNLKYQHRANSLIAAEILKIVN